MTSKRLIVILSVSIIFVACSDNSHQVSNEETIRNDESEQASETVANFEKLLKNYKTKYVARGAHAKGHACVKSYFEVLENINPRYQHGVFAVPGRRYKTWVRFSNGHFDLSISQDYRKDARGMAVKLFDPPGEPIQLAANGIPTQDFLMATSPVFFASDIAMYNQLVNAPEDFTGYFFGSWNPFNWRLKELQAATRVLIKPPTSPLWPQYFSITPYKLGPLNIKFSTRPCAPRQSIVEFNRKEDPDFLNKTLQKELEQGEGCFEFLVQEQNTSKNMPLEDPTVEWKESDSPFHPIARINIPQQEFNSIEQRSFCENLSFAPWHALPEHRPLGQFNRLRRHAYPASSNYRHAENKTRIPLSLNW